MPKKPYIERLNAAFEKQCRKGWPQKLRLPLPETAEEKEHLDLWLAELHRATGAKITVDFVAEGHA